MSNTNIYNENIITTKIKIPPINLNKNYQKYILLKLQKEYEGKYTKFGLIKENSIDLIKTSLGKLEQHSFQGNILYNVLFKAQICNPVIGNVVLCEVTNINNFGILCSSKENDKIIIEIIIPKKSFAIKSDIDLNDIKIGHKVYVEIAGKKPQLNDTKIKCIGRIIKTSNKSKIKLDNIINEQGIEDDDQIIKEDVDIEYEESEDDDDDVGDENDNTNLDDIGDENDNTNLDDVVNDIVNTNLDDAGNDIVNNDIVGEDDKSADGGSVIDEYDNISDDALSVISDNI